jgi:putative FmdB family regulatory protein
MPIYAYKCSSCGFAKDVLQKISDEPLAVCPSCGAASFSKQITAAGFQLKGSGWYVTDFRNNGSGAKKDAGESGEAKPAEAPAADGKPADSTQSSKGDTAASPSPASAAAPAPAPASASPSAKSGSSGT